MSRHTISTLQEKLRDLQRKYENDLDTMQKQLDVFYKAIADIEEGEGDEDGDIVIPRQEFAKAMGRIKAQESLEGKTSKDGDGEPKENDKVRSCLLGSRIQSLIVVLFIF